MASPREIRLKLRIDDDGLPLDLRKVTDAIGKAFDGAAASAAASFKDAANEIIKSMAAIAKTPLAAEPIGLKHLDALSDRLTAIQAQLAAVSAAGAAVAAGMPALPSAAAGGAGAPPRVPPTAVGAASPAPGGPNRLPASVQLANRAAALTGQNATAARVVAEITPSAGGSVSRMTSLLNALNTAAGGVHKSISRIGPVVDRLTLGFAGLGGAVTVARAVGSAFDAVAGRVRALGDNFIDAVEKSRKFELAIGGVVGAARARDLNYSLVSRSRDLPASVADLRETGQTFAALPAIAGRLNDSNGLDQVVGLNRTIGRLATLDPAQGQQGATVAIREVLEGGGTGDSFNSLRRRFGLTASTLSRAIGASVDDIKADPALALRAIEKITSTLIPDSIVDQSKQLFPAKVQKITDALSQSLVKIGDSGVYDQLTARIDRVMKSVFDAVDSDKFAAQARKISAAADRTIGSVSDSIEQFLRKATGARADQPLLEVVGDAIAKAIERLGGVLENLPAIAEKIGAGVGAVTAELGRLTDALVDIADATRNPGKVAGRLGDYTQQRAWSYLTDTDLGQLGNSLGAAAAGGLRAIGNDKPLPQAVASATAQPSVQTSAIADGDFGRLIRQLDTAGGVLPNFAATNLAAASGFGRLDDLTRETDKLSDLRGAGRNAFAASGEAVGRLQEQFLKAIDTIDNALADAETRLRTATDPSEINQLRGGIASINRTREQLTAAFGEAGKAAADGLTEAGRDFRRGLANGLADLPLGGAAALQAANGRNQKIDAAMEKLRAIGVEGGPTELSSWAIKDRQSFWKRMADRGLGDIQSQSQLGTLKLGMTAEEINRAVSHRPDDVDVQRQQAELISSQLLPAQSGILADANARLTVSPNDPLALADAARATEQYAQLASQLQQLRESVDGLAPAFTAFAEAARHSIESGLSGALFELIKGTDDVQAAFSRMADEILRQFIEMQVQMIARAAIGNLGQQQSNGQAGSGGGWLGALASIFIAAGNAYTGGAGNAGVAVAGATTAANGAVFPGHFEAFAAGGIATKPMLGLIGERADRVPEAVVPMLGAGGRIPLVMGHDGSIAARLPGNRSIPAVLENHTRRFADGGVVGQLASGEHWRRGTGKPESRERVIGSLEDRASTGRKAVEANGQLEPKIFVVSDVDQAVKAGLRKHQDILVSAISGNIAKGGALAKQMRGR